MLSPLLDAPDWPGRVLDSVTTRNGFAIDAEESPRQEAAETGRVKQVAAALLAFSLLAAGSAYSSLFARLPLFALAVTLLLWSFAGTLRR